MWDCHESGTTSEYPATSDDYCLLLQITIQITIHTIHMQISGRVFWSLAPCDGIVSIFVWTIQSCFWEDVHINAWIIEIFAYIFNMPVQWPWIQHTSSSVLTIAWKDSVKTTLGWYLTRLRVLVWLCRKEIATAFVYVWLMKGIFTLNPSIAKDFLPFTFPWQDLFNPSAGFVIPKRGSVFPITDFSFPKWGS